MSKSFTLSELAGYLHADLQGGDPTQRISGVRGIESAGPEHLTFVSNPRYAALARTTAAGAILVSPSFPPLSTPTLRAADPYLTLAHALSLFHTPRPFAPGVHPSAVLSPSARLGARAHVGPLAVIMDDVEIGDDAVILPHTVLYPGVRAGHRLLLHAHAVLREDTVVGDDVIIGNGVVIGGDGFGFARKPDGSWHKIPQTGRVLIESGVEIQANACVDRGALGDTTIRQGVKVDNLVQVGHGSVVGENTLLCAQVGLAGSTSVGQSVILAGQVGVAGHCTIGDRVVATAQSGIPSDVPAGSTVSGYPAIENRQWLRAVATFNRLPSLIRNITQERK